MSIDASAGVIIDGLPVTFRDKAFHGDPEGFSDSYMLAYDFDEFCFTASISSGRGPEVHEAYSIAVRTVLGGSAEQDFTGYGGLSNRAPLDVIQGLLTTDVGLVHTALDHAKEHFANTEDRSDIGLDIISRFADRSEVEPDELTIRAITEMLVIRKKEVLLPQINSAWPVALDGFVEHWTSLYEMKAGDWENVHTAIVSSGHTDFIQKTLEVSGLPQPDVYMTDDEMRRQVTPRTKPDPFALQLARNAWFNAYAIPVGMRTEAFLEKAKYKQLYGGDDLVKDGQMAANDGIGFVYYDGSPGAWEAIGRTIIETIKHGGGFDTE